MLQMWWSIQDQELLCVGFPEIFFSPVAKGVQVCLNEQREDSVQAGRKEEEVGSQSTSSAYPQKQVNKSQQLTRFLKFLDWTKF